jgi:hypothetical protein
VAGYWLMTGVVFVTFVFTTLIHEPASIATLAGILVLSVAWTTDGNEAAPTKRARSKSGS